MEASPRPPGARKPETELGAVSTTAVPHPDSRSGPSPHSQGRVMDEQRTVFVGIDVSKDRLDVHLRPSGEAFCVPREGKGVDDLVIRLRGLSVALVVLEATGGFEATVAAALAGVGLPLCVVNPRQIRDFARAMSRLAKTDTLDAEVIALFAERVRPQARPLREPERVHLAELVGRRRQIIEMIGMETNRGRQAIDKPLARRLARHVAYLQKELDAIDHDIGDAIKHSPAWREAEALLKSVPCIGDVTARTLSLNCRTRDCQPPSGRCPGWRRPDQSQLWSDAWPQGHCRWSDSVRAVLYMAADCHPVSSPFSGLLRPAHCPWPTQEGRPRCSDAGRLSRSSTPFSGITRRGAL